MSTRTVIGIVALADLIGVSKKSVHQHIVDGVLHPAGMCRTKLGRVAYYFDPIEVKHYRDYRLRNWKMKPRSIRMLEYMQEQLRTTSRANAIKRTALHFRVKPASIKRALQRREKLRKLTETPREEATYND